MSYPEHCDAKFTKDGSEWAVLLDDGMMRTYKDGEFMGGTFVASLDPVPEPTIIEPDPEPVFEGPEPPAKGEPPIEPAR